MAFEAGLFDTEHKINKFAFGESFPGLVNPLEGMYKGGSPPKQLYSYYTKVVPTSYRCTVCWGPTAWRVCVK